MADKAYYEKRGVEMTISAIETKSGRKYVVGYDGKDSKRLRQLVEGV